MASLIILLSLLPSYRYPVDFLLNELQEACGVRAVHLRVVKLEGDGQCGAQEAAPVFAPDEEGVVEQAAVHAHGAVDVVARQRGGAYHHAVGQVVADARAGYLAGEPQVVGVEGREFFGERDVARADFAATIGHNGVDGDGVVGYQSVAYRQHPELLHLTGGAADAPAHEHVELQVVFAAEAHEALHFERLEERDHGHRGLHPGAEGVGAGGCLGVDLFHAASFWRQSYGGKSVRDRTNGTFQTVGGASDRGGEQIGVGAAALPQAARRVAAEGFELAYEVRLVGIAAVVGHGGAGPAPVLHQP